MFLAALAMVALASPATAETVSPYDSSKLGKLQCMSPDNGSRTCSSISRYEMAADGSLLSEDVMQLTEDPDTRITTRVPSTLNGNKICQKIDPALIEAAKVTRDGAAVSNEEATRVRQDFASRVATLLNKTFCMDLSGDDPLYIAVFELDGKEMPSLTTRMRLIGRDDGYRLRPIF